jgi:hypothetical protein
MREARRTVLGGALGVLLGALPLTGAGAQVPIPDLRFQPPAAAATIPRPTAIESHYTRIRFGGAAGRRTVDGVGLRLVFGARPLDDEVGDAAGTTTRAGLARRTELALFATHARESRRPHDERLATTSLGVAADLRPLARPVASRIDPFVSLGVGLLRTRDAELAPPMTLRWPPARVERTRSSAALLPGVGTRLLVTPRVALQAEARDLFSRGRHNVAFGTGLRLSL